MSKKPNRPAWERDAGQEAPVPYRLPPARPPTPSQKLPAGCWSTGILILLSLTLLGCGIAEGVRKFAEPVDTAGCKFDCRRADKIFSRYIYETNTCCCLDADKNEVELYGLDRDDLAK